VRVDAHLEAAALEIRDAVDSSGEINPGRRVGGGESLIPGGSAEVHHRLSRGYDSLAEELWKHSRQPGAACEHEDVTGQRRSIHQTQGRYASRRGGLACPAPSHEHAFTRELRRQRLDRASGHDDATLGLEHRARDVASVKVRIASAEGSLIEQVDRVAPTSKRRERFLRVPVAVGSDP
jgi:hypothetical protein